MEIEKEQVITAVKGLTRRVNIKQEHLEIIDQALEYNDYSQEEWEEILNLNNINLALNNKIYTMEMVRLLTLRAIILPDTIIEYFTWLSEGKNSNNNPLNYSLSFQQQIDKFCQNDNSLLIIKIQLQQGINIIKKELYNLNIVIQSLEKFVSDNKNLWKESFKKYKEKEDRRKSYEYYKKGENLYEEGKYRKAIIEFNKAIELNPNFAKAYNWRGRAYIVLEKFKKALADYNKALEIDPNYAHAYNCRGCYYKNLEQYKKAISDYDKAIEISPKYQSVYINRGDSYRKLKQYNKAISDYNKVIELDTKDKWAYVDRGRSYEKLKEYSKAISDYNKAIEIDTDYKVAYQYLFHLTFSIWLKECFIPLLFFVFYCNLMIYVIWSFFTSNWSFEDNIKMIFITGIFIFCILMTIFIRPSNE